MTLTQQRFFRSALILCIAVAMARPIAQAAIYQYAVPVAQRTAYLWVPPACHEVRGVAIAMANLTERQWLEDPIVRKAAADECLGILWLGPGDESVVNAEMKPGSGEALTRMLQDLATQSGFPELAFAPVIAMGHSAHGNFSWRFAEWAPERTIAAMPIKTYPLPPEIKLHGVPMLYAVGETTEWPQYRDGSRPGDRDFFWPVVRETALALRTEDPHNLIGVAIDAGGGHFDWSNGLAKLVAANIRAVCKLRLPPHASKTGPVKLRPIPIEQGWLIDTSGMQPDRFPPAPYTKYRGNRTQAYWFPDRATAMEAMSLQGDRKRRQVQMVTLLQDGKPLPVATIGYAPLRFEPEHDGISFTVQGAFLSELPKELVGAGTPLGHAPVPIRFRAISGPIEQTGPAQFRVAMGRGDTGGEAWIDIEADGDASYRRAVQPARVIIPAKLTDGEPQSIHFAPIPDRKASAGAIALQATSTSGLPVRFYVLSGPAEVEGSELRIADLPQGGSATTEVSVVAYQWGQSAGAGRQAVQTAEPITQRFRITR